MMFLAVFIFKAPSTAILCRIEQLSRLFFLSKEQTAG